MIFCIFHKLFYLHRPFLINLASICKGLFQMLPHTWEKFASACKEEKIVSINLPTFMLTMFTPHAFPLSCCLLPAFSLPTVPLPTVPLPAVNLPAVPLISVPLPSFPQSTFILPLVLLSRFPSHLLLSHFPCLNFPLSWFQLSHFQNYLHPFMLLLQRFTEDKSYFQKLLSWITFW